MIYSICPSLYDLFHLAQCSKSHSHGWIIVHCVYILHLLYPFMFWQTLEVVSVSWLLWKRHGRRAWQPTPVFLPGEAPWTGVPGRLQSMGGCGVGHDWATEHELFHVVAQIPLLLISFRIDWFDFLAVQRTQLSSPAPQLESVNSLVLSILCGLTLTSVHNCWKNHSFDYIDLCLQSNAL